MKYTDEPGIGASVLIDAPPAVVWSLISDPMTPAQFENELVKAEWETAPNGPELGAVFRGYNHHPELGWSWDVACTIVRFDEGRLFGWRIEAEDQGGAAEWWFTVDAAGDGTRLWFQATMGPGPSGLTPAIESMPDREHEIVMNRLDSWHENMLRTLDGIKSLAEADA